LEFGSRDFIACLNPISTWFLLNSYIYGFFWWNFSLLLFMLGGFICEQNFMNSYLCNLSTPIFKNKMMNVTMLMMVKIVSMKSPQQENMIQMRMILTSKKPQWHKEMWWWILVEGGRVGGERSLQSLFKGDQFIGGVNWNMHALRGG